MARGKRRCGSSVSRTSDNARCPAELRVRQGSFSRLVGQGQPGQIGLGRLDWRSRCPLSGDGHTFESCRVRWESVCRGRRECGAAYIAASLRFCLYVAPPIQPPTPPQDKTGRVYTALARASGSSAGSRRADEQLVGTVSGPQSPEVKLV